MSDKCIYYTGSWCGCWI